MAGENNYNFPYNSNFPRPYNTTQYPIRVIDSANKTDILEQRGEEFVLIGRTLAYCQDLEETCNQALAKAEEYYTMLVDNGIIEKPKTPEELATEQTEALKQQAEQQAEINAKLLETINKLSNKIDGLEVELNGRERILFNNNVGTEETQSEDGRQIEPKSAVNSKSNGRSKKISA
ncbi:MAG: hypothetical protein FWF92_07660 [Oscillospiraceae bacterium]|nr:hypothetical protein [Oscillospiraceae bacterium]